jgi:hypothetical protein
MISNGTDTDNFRWNYNLKAWQLPEDFGGLKFEFVLLESAIETNRA